MAIMIMTMLLLIMMLMMMMMEMMMMVMLMMMMVMMMMIMMMMMGVSVTNDRHVKVRHVVAVAFIHTLTYILYTSSTVAILGRAFHKLDA